MSLGGIELNKWWG